VTSEKLLVLSDTRSIYTPLNSGVFWHVQDYLLQDIERIEVIRGPGAALWGSNAVNGVINITTKKAQDTQGAYFEGMAGDEERLSAAARFGGTMANGVSYRIFAKHFDRDDTRNAAVDTSDEWRLSHLGFRADWDASQVDAVTLQADLYRGDIGLLSPSATVIGRPGPQGDLETEVNGGNILGRWRHTIDEDSDVEFRVYYDRTHRDDPSFVDDLDTFDLDFQHSLRLARRQEVIWGVNYRFTDNRNKSGGIFNVEPASAKDHLISAFVQDQISFSEALRVTLGSKFEHNDFSGFELQPSVRVAWDFLPGQMLWSAVSRAARVPTRLERDIALDASNPAGNPVIRLQGNRDFDSEELNAYELGYRWQAVKGLSLDVAAFENRYEGLASLELGQPYAEGGRTIIPILNRNLTDGRARGIETLVTYTPLPVWRLSLSYSFVDLDLDPKGQDLNRGRFMEGATPRHQVGLRSFLDLPGGLQFDAQYRRLSDIRSTPVIVSGEGIDGYSELDVRLAWRGESPLEISVVGQNLLHESHVEFGAPASRGAIERSVYAKVTWGF
jgi:iron complex outermembrane receptor protein